MTELDIEREKYEVSKLDTAYLIEELYLRGVTTEAIGGRYYEFTEAANGRMTDTGENEPVE